MNTVITNEVAVDTRGIRVIAQYLNPNRIVRYGVLTYRTGITNLNSNAIIGKG